MLWKRTWAPGRWQVESEKAVPCQPGEASMSWGHQEQPLQVGSPAQGRDGLNDPGGSPPALDLL